MWRVIHRWIWMVYLDQAQAIIFLRSFCSTGQDPRHIGCATRSRRGGSSFFVDLLDKTLPATIFIFFLIFGAEKPNGTRPQSWPAIPKLSAENRITSEKYILVDLRK